MLLLLAVCLIMVGRKQATRARVRENKRPPGRAPIMHRDMYPEE